MFSHMAVQSAAWRGVIRALTVLTLGVVLLCAGCGTARENRGGMSTPQNLTPLATRQGSPFPVLPPSGVLTHAGQEQTGGLSSYCWQGSCRTAAGIPIPAAVLTVPAGAVLHFIYGGETPLTELIVTAFPLAESPLPSADGQRRLDWQLLRTAPGTPAIIVGTALPSSPSGLGGQLVAAVPPGEYAFLVSARMQGGDLSYGFYVTVKTSAPAS